MVLYIYSLCCGDIKHFEEYLIAIISFIMIWWNTDVSNLVILYEWSTIESRSTEYTDK